MEHDPTLTGMAGYPANAQPQPHSAIAKDSTEEQDMAGELTPNDIATLSLLNGSAGYTREAYDGTVINNNVARNGLQMTEQHNQITAQVRSNDINNKMETLQRQLSDTRFELANISQQNRIETLQQINDARAEAAKCCCETKELVLRENAATRSLLLEQQIQSRDATIQQMQNAQLLAAVSKGNS